VPVATTSACYPRSRRGFRWLLQPAGTSSDLHWAGLARAGLTAAVPARVAGGGRGSRWPAGRHVPSSRAGCILGEASGRDPAVEATGGMLVIRTYVRAKCEGEIYSNRRSYGADAACHGPGLRGFRPGLRSEYHGRRPAGSCRPSGGAGRKVRSAARQSPVPRATGMPGWRPATKIISDVPGNGRPESSAGRPKARRAAQITS